MGILDDAIREHLDLKRRHGAREAELREIEDEAFGAGDQPDPFVSGDVYTEVATETPDAGNEDPTRLVESDALRPSEPATESEGLPSFEQPPEALRPSETPPAPESPPPSSPDLELSDEALSAPPSPLPGQVELPGQDEIPGQERLDAESEPEPFTAEPESYRPSEDAPEGPEAPAPSESLEELIAEEEPFPEDTEAQGASATEADPESRPLEPRADAQAPPEPESHVPDPPPPPPATGAEPPGRARGRIDVPTQEHPPPGDTGDLPPLPGGEELGRPDTSYEPPPMELAEEEPISDELPLSEAEPISDEEPLPADDTEGSDGPQLYDFETDEEPAAAPAGETAVDDDFEALGPAEEEAPYLDEEEPYAEEPGTEVRPAVESDEPRERRSSDTEERSFELEEEEGEEGLWFEKGPPKDFDFDD
jgi:hypothetical protein